MLDFLIELDKKWFLFLNSYHNPFFDGLMHTISATGTWIPFYLVLIFFIIKKLKWKGFFPLLFLILVIVTTDQGSVHLFKNTVQRLRPCHNPEIAQLVHLVNNECGGNFGFISSHAANTFALAIFSALFFKNKIYTVFIFIWATIVSYSRIYLGVHFVFDVWVGVLYGLFIGYLFFKLYLHFMYKIAERKKLE